MRSIPNKAKKLSVRDQSLHSWQLLGRFLNVEETTRKLQFLHQVPQKHIPNIKKQAEQIRYCLIQAREYRNAAMVATLATRPTLLYYSVLSLATAQVLFKGTGELSLDRAREKHRHHGLTFRPISTMKETELFPELASRLISVPLEISGSQSGSFALWHKYSRELPIFGARTVLEGEGRTESIRIIFDSEDIPFCEIPKTGYSFLDIVKASPCMMSHLGSSGVASRVIRAKVSDTLRMDGVLDVSIVVHPAPQDILAEALEGFLFNAYAVERIKYTQFRSGISLKFQYQPSDNLECRFPQAVTWNDSDIRFIPRDVFLNEFGLFYYGLHMLGSYSRYFQDYWMRDVESSNLMSHLIEIFLSYAEWRCALLTVAELDHTYYILD